MFGIAFVGGGDVFEKDNRPVGRADGEIVECGDLTRGGIELYNVFAVAEARSAGREDKVLLVDGGRDVAGGKVLGVKQVRIGIDHHLAHLAAIG